MTKDRTADQGEDLDELVISSGTDELEITAHDWFSGDSMVWLDKAVRIIRSINAAEGPEDFISSIRTSPFREFNPVDLAQWNSPVVIDTLQDISWSLPSVVSPGANEVSALGFIQINARRKNGDRAAIFFVEEEGELFLDWDATTIWSEVPIKQFIEEKPRGGAILRARIEKKRIYDEVVNGVTYSGYLVTSADGAEFFFAYIPLDTDKQRLDDERVKTVLNYGRFVGKLLKNQPLTIRVRYGDGKGGGKHFEIIDLIHSTWVRPQ